MNPFYTPYLFKKVDLNKDLELIESHLLALSSEDRFTRFLGVKSDNAIRNFVSSLDPASNYLYALVDSSYNSPEDYVALSQLSKVDPEGVYEFAITVDGRKRGSGLGKRLTNDTFFRARNNNIKKIICHCYSSNEAVKKILKEGGVEKFHSDNYSELDGELELKGMDLASLSEESYDEFVTYYSERYKRLVSYFADIYSEELLG